MERDQKTGDEQADNMYLTFRKFNHFPATSIPPFSLPLITFHLTPFFELVETFLRANCAVKEPRDFKQPISPNFLDIEKSFVRLPHLYNSI